MLFRSFGIAIEQAVIHNDKKLFGRTTSDTLIFSAFIPIAHNPVNRQPKAGDLRSRTNLNYRRGSDQIGAVVAGILTGKRKAHHVRFAPVIGTCMSENSFFDINDPPHRLPTMLKNLAPSPPTRFALLLEEFFQHEELRSVGISVETAHPSTRETL